MLVVWHQIYCDKFGLRYTDPVGDKWFGLYLGDDLIAASGESLVHGAIKVTSLLAAPTRDGVWGTYELLRMYRDIARYYTNVLCEVLYVNRSMRRRVERVAHTEPVGVIYLLRHGST